MTSANGAEHNDHSKFANVIIKCNKHGAVITLSDKSKYYMGKNCDAYQPGVGSGHWWLAASAYIVRINEKHIRLPFDIECDLPYCKFPGKRD